MNVIEEVIKKETEKRVNELKEKLIQNGSSLSNMDELYLRMGIAYGISIAGLGLVNIDAYKLTVKEN